jgi:hypothetical protein
MASHHTSNVLSDESSGLKRLDEESKGNLRSVANYA